MPRLTDFDVISFDCYGTLIDWEAGIRTALAGWRRRENIQVTDQGFMEAFGRYEWEVQEQETRELLYPEILGRVLKRMAAGWGVRASPDGCDKLRSLRVASGPPSRIPPGAGLPEAAFQAGDPLQRGSGILQPLQRQARAWSSTMSSPPRTSAATSRTWRTSSTCSRTWRSEGYPERHSILHTAESLYHDHIPAKKLGLHTNWIYRRHDKQGFGATRPPTEKVIPDFRFNSMAEFAPGTPRRGSSCRLERPASCIGTHRARSR